MPAEPARLARAIRQTVHGPVWHGDALAVLLDGIGPIAAAAHPIPGAHSIWELVLHITAWVHIAQARLQGDGTGDPTEQEDWPKVGRATTARWTAARSRLISAHASLATAVSRLPTEALEARVTGRRYTIRSMLQGVVEHGAYHGGQIALLIRAIDMGAPM
jgi:uncharacterized damage-inducible protein DinB